MKGFVLAVSLAAVMVGQGAAQKKSSPSAMKPGVKSASVPAPPWIVCSQSGPRGPEYVLGDAKGKCPRLIWGQGGEMKAVAGGYCVNVAKPEPPVVCKVREQVKAASRK